VAIYADAKLVASHQVGGRNAYAANLFVPDLAGRLAGRFQVTSDGLRLDVEAVERAFGADVDFAQLAKLHGDAPEGQKRYGPARPSASAASGRRRAVPPTRSTSRPATPSGRISRCGWAADA
jgi:hypothetical protein